MAYATVQDVKAIWPGFPTGQDERAAALLEDAAVRIDAYAPAPEPLTARDAAVRKTISREMVMFVMASDPSLAEIGVASRSRTMGPFSEQWTFDRPGRTLMLTDEHKRMLRPTIQEAFTVAAIPTPPIDPLEGVRL